MKRYLARSSHSAHARRTRLTRSLWWLCSGLFSAAAIQAPATLNAQERTLHKFERVELTDTYFSEGASAGDLNQDGHGDVVYGPFWFAGPEFSEQHEIYAPVPQNREGYADNFFSWVHDFNGDGLNDVFVVGFPGTPAYVYENPGPDAQDKHWPKHQVIDWVSNESPQFVDLVGDERPELVCTRDGFFGFATVNWDEPFGAWTFHPISEQIAASRFGHGLGVGDVNGDGLNDIIHAGGWYQQPEQDAANKRWNRHNVAFTHTYGGADMFAYDVDGDGDNDIITSDAAHDFGLGWYEQVTTPDGPTFKYHTIMGSHPSENKYGVLFSEPHSVALADMDGDGLKDIVTGKTYYSHHRQSPMWDAGAVVYWFRLTRTKDGVDWLPYRADGESGIGRQLTVQDVNNDGLLDFIVGGMKGANVLLHHVESVDEQAYQAAQPKLYDGPPVPSVDNAEAKRGPKSKLNDEGAVGSGAIEGESLQVKLSGGNAATQAMNGFSADRWSNNSHLFWTGAKPGDTLEVKLPNAAPTFDLELVMTCAPDYAIVQLEVDGQALGNPIDLFDPQVITTGVLRFEKIQAKGAGATLVIRVAGANPKAKKAYMVGIDYLRTE